MDYNKNKNRNILKKKYKKMSSPTCYQIIFTSTLLPLQWQCLSCLFWTSSSLCCVISTCVCCKNMTECYLNKTGKKSCECSMSSSSLCCVESLEPVESEEAVESEESVEPITSENQI